MNILQKAHLFFTLLFLGKKGSFTFYAGNHKYLAEIAYTSEHQFLSVNEIMLELTSLFMRVLTFPTSIIVGNIQVTVSLVS